ncbi:hypothetical protein JMJ56_19545 [Belnapia sp. T18]|uniref:Uncharacterized protein n=1 Tax=Belnapia arida TaxID=2804533 RepID=A0ABS1UAB0_9PROT|nr:hypothetical protein [Belnapia arida]MBL6080216.1 hypothetical protein [Belnapia arida]
MSASCFHAGAAARLHVLHGQPVMILARPPLEPTPDLLGQPGGMVVFAHIAPGADHLDPLSEALAAGALSQGGVVALLFDNSTDAMAYASRIAHDDRASAPGGVA